MLCRHGDSRGIQCCGTRPTETPWYTESPPITISPTPTDEFMTESPSPSPEDDGIFGIERDWSLPTFKWGW